MYAIVFDLKVDNLKETHGESYNEAYDEIRHALTALGFNQIQGSVYVNKSSENGIIAVYKAISCLSEIDWFKKSVQDISVFKMEDLSDFTDVVKY